MRVILSVLPFLLLNACNVVVSREPWFTRADEQGAPKLRSGVWIWPGDADCKVNESQPVDRWPDCASPVIVDDHRLIAIHPPTDGRPTQPDEVDYALAAGEPLLLQISDCIEDEAGDGTAQKLHCYIALKPLTLDSEGRITRFTSWFVLCGPPPRNNRDMGGGVSDRPYPGLRIKGSNCEAASADALRAAARSSEAETIRAGTKAMVPHWVRDGSR